MKFINTFFAIILISSMPIESAEENFIGDVNLGEVTHSDAFNFIKDNMLGKWKGKLTQHSGNVIEASYHFKLVSNGNIKSTLNRENIWLAQTPQSFQKDKFINAFKKASAKGLSVTDESALMEDAGFSVALVPGGNSNFKVTTPQDWEHARGFLK